MSFEIKGYAAEACDACESIHEYQFDHKPNI
jgi:hypothetical protein